MTRLMRRACLRGRAGVATRNFVWPLAIFLAALLLQAPSADAQTATDITVGGVPYKVLTFKGNGNWIAPPNVKKVEYLIVAGGGSGGSSGGGGGGGVLAGNAAVTPGTSYPIMVGGGGRQRNNGQDSKAFGNTAKGGGRGGHGNSGGYFGGSGGGSGHNFPRYPMPGTAGQGYSGGISSRSRYGGGGGGGGGGGNGKNATNQSSTIGRGGDGGIGFLSSITGTATRYAGGGGGGANVAQGLRATGGGTGGAGGGGNGARAHKQIGQDGSPNTGGGGGSEANVSRGTNGGSGVVIIRYVKKPEIKVTSSEGGVLADNGADLQGDEPAGTARTVIYTVTNTGIADLTLEQATVTGVPIKVAIGTITAPVKPKLAPGEETTFEVSYTPTAAGDFSFDLSIRNNDPDENPFKFTVKGTAAANPAITSGQIGSFMQARSELILANQPGIGRRLDRLNGRTGGATGISGFGLSLTHPALPFSARLGRNEGSFAWSLQNARGQSGKANLQADPGAIAGALGIPRSDDTAANNIHGPSSSGLLALGPTSRDVSYPGIADADPATDPMARRFDVWAQGTYAGYSASGGKGRFAIVHAGADYLVNPNLLIGLGLQTDWTTMDAASNDGRVAGYGFMAGPYATARLADGFYADARIAWGRSFNKISPFGTYTNPFRAERWLGSAALIGETAWNAFTIRPELRLSWFRERSKAYVDTLGVAIPAVTVETGTLAFGPTFTRPFELANGMLLTPHLTVEGIWTFAQTNTATAFSKQPGLGETGVRGRVEAGLNLADDKGTSVTASAFYDGIGNADFKAWGAKLSVHKAF